MGQIIYFWLMFLFLYLAVALVIIENNNGSCYSIRLMCVMQVLRASRPDITAPVDWA